MKLTLGKAQAAHVDGELLSGYLDNQVTPEQRRRVEEHLRTCTDCRAELSSLRQTVALLHAMPRVAVPRAFTLSEAAVGARRPASAPWIWGAARALGGVAALVVIAALAVLIMKPGQGALPASQVALNKAPAAAAPTSGGQTEAAPAAALQQPSVASPALNDRGAPTASQASKAAPTTAAAAAPAAATAALRQAVAPTPARAASSAPAPVTQAPAAPAPLQAAPSSAAAGSAPAGRPSPYPSASPMAAADATAAAGLPARAMGLAASPTESTSAAPALGLGGGGGGEGGGGMGAAGLAGPVTPPPLPPAAALASSLPAGAGIVSTDGQTLVAIDSRGKRTLAQAEGINRPLISPDRAWVAYYVQAQDHAEIRAVRWDGSNPHMVASETAVPGLQQFAASEGPHIIEVRWIPGGHNLSLLLDVPSPQNRNGRTNELWTVSAESDGLRKVLALDPANVDYRFSPDGSTLAVLERGQAGQGGEGFLILYNSDGSNARTGLQFPANSKGYGYESQLAWLPDSSALLVAIPDQNAEGYGDTSGASLYRVSAQGRQAQSQLIGRVSATATSWSPNGKLLAFYQFDAQGLNGTLNVGNADGSNAATYALLSPGRFMSWSPDNRHFLYSSGGQIYVGAQGETPRAVAPESAVLVAQWIGPSQVIYLVTQGDSWALATYTLDGKNNSLRVSLPGAVMVDMTQR